MAGITIKGLEEMAKKFGMAVERFSEAARVGVYAQGLALDELINRNDMVPVKSGALRESHFVTLPEVRGEVVTSRLGYGAPYAAEVHERSSVNGFRGLKGEHKTHNSWRNGTPKWMERGVSMWARSYSQRIQKDIAQAAANGTRVEDLLGIVPTEPHYSPAVMGKGRAYSREQANRFFVLSRKKKLISRVGRKKDRRYWAEKKGQVFVPKRPPRNTGSKYRTKKGE